MTKQITMTPAEVAEMIAAERGNMPRAADFREELREKLKRLPAVARGVYLHNDLRRENVDTLTAVECVLYSFDYPNFCAVAERLEMEPAALQLVLLGFVLGAGE